MNLDWMTAFLEAARTGSLNKTAERLHMTQPAVSQQIRRLEDHFGVALLHRTSTGVTPTEAGSLLLARGRLWVEEWRSLERELGAYRQDRLVTFGTLPSFAAAYLPRQTEALQRRKLKLDIRVANTSEELQRLLKQGEVEAAVLEAGYTGGFCAAELLVEPFLAVVPERHPLAARPSISLEELGREPLIVHPPSCDIRRRLTGALAKLGLAPAIAVEAAFGEQVLGYVAAGAGLAVVPEMTARLLLLPGLRALPIAGLDEQRHLAVAARSRKLGGQLLKALARAGGE